MNTLSLMDRSEVALADVIAINDSVVGSQQIKLCQVLFILCLSGIYNSMAFRVACLWINVQKCYCISILNLRSKKGDEHTVL